MNIIIENNSKTDLVFNLKKAKKAFMVNSNDSMIIRDIDKNDLYDIKKAIASSFMTKQIIIREISQIPEQSQIINTEEEKINEHQSQPKITLEDIKSE